MDTCATLVPTPHLDFTPVCLIDDRAARERDLISQAQDGSLEAFNELVLTYQDAVYRQAFWMLDEEEAAEDAAQDVFLTVFRKLNTFRGGSFRAWVLRITTNYCLDQIRSWKNQRCLPFEQYYQDGEEKEADWTKALDDLPEQAVERLETREIINRCFQKLTPEYRSILLLVDIQELDYQEASAVLGLPIGTVKSRLARARQKLQGYLFVTLKN
jgi:RNA polymerase sigma-70 factor (ECF subfamily)